MAVGAFPIFKLSALAIKQASKPLAKVITNHAKKVPFFRKYVCMPPAQLYNWMEVRYKMWVMDLGSPAKVPHLTEPMAIELGANLIGEFIIFLICAYALYYEYVRSQKSSAKKESAGKNELAQMKRKITDIGMELEKHSALIREMTRVLAEMDSRHTFRLRKTEQSTLPREALPLQGETFSYSLYDPTRSYVFSALNYIETKIF